MRELCILCACEVVFSSTLLSYITLRFTCTTIAAILTDALQR